MPFATADGRTIPVAYADAGAADPDMTGVRVELDATRRPLRARIMGDDGAGRWAERRIDDAMARMTQLAEDGALDIHDADGVDAWHI